MVVRLSVLLSLFSRSNRFVKLPYCSRFRFPVSWRFISSCHCSFIFCCACSSVDVMMLTLSGVRALSMYLFPWSCSSRSSVWLCSSAALRPPRFMRWCGVLIVICPVVIFLYLYFWGFHQNPFYLIFIFFTCYVVGWFGVLVKTLLPSCSVSHVVRCCCRCGCACMWWAMRCVLFVGAR